MSFTQLSGVTTMRAVLCIFGFCSLTAATVMAQGIGGGTGAPPLANCDGTKAFNEKCNGGVPPPCYIEMANCQPKYKGNDGCKKTIAFAQDDFACSAPKADPGPPPFYSTLCLDSSDII